MKRTITNFFTFIFLGFLLLGGICIVQNLCQEIEKKVSNNSDPHPIVAYQKQI